VATFVDESDRWIGRSTPISESIMCVAKWGSQCMTSSFLLALLGGESVPVDQATIVS